MSLPLKVRYEAHLAQGSATYATEVLDGIAIDVTQGSAITTTVRPAGHDQFVPATGALGVDDSSATARLSWSGARSALYRSAGYNQPALPAGAVVDGLTLQVTHVLGAGIAGAKVVFGCDTKDVPPNGRPSSP